MNGTIETLNRMQAEGVTQERRRRLAALSFTEKIRILEKLRGRSLAIAAAGLRAKKSKDQDGDKPRTS